MASQKLKGIFTALVTPFHEDGSVDLEAFKMHVRAQVAAGVSGFVVLGTTGEAPTLNDQEKLELVSSCIEASEAKIPVIAGASANCTKTALKQQKMLEELDIFATIYATPWYNKPNQKGIYEHYRALNDAARKPIILYNVPCRTGADIAPETVLRLLKCENIIGIKDANTCTARFQQYVYDAKQQRPDFSILSGEDAFLLPLLAMGGDGVVAVTSNLAPGLMLDVWRHYREGRQDLARSHANKLCRVAKILFSHTNPIPVKTALSLQNHMKACFRLPITQLNGEETAQLRSLLAKEGY